MSMLARGPSVIPSDGLGMIAEWTSAVDPPGGRGGGARHAGRGARDRRPGRAPGDRRAHRGRPSSAARHVVLAVEAPAARGLLAPLDPAAADRMPREAASSVSAPPSRCAARSTAGRSIVLNARRAARGRRLARRSAVPDHQHHPPGRARRAAHPARHARHDRRGGGADGLVEAVGDAGRGAGRRASTGRASPSRSASTSTPSPSSVPSPGVRERLPGPRTAVENLVLAGRPDRPPLDRGRGVERLPGGGDRRRADAVRLVGDRRVFTVEDVTARLSGMFEGLTSFWVEAEVQDLRPARTQMRFTLRGEHVLDASMNGIVFERLAHRPGRRHARAGLRAHRVLAPARPDLDAGREAGAGGRGPAAGAGGRAARAPRGGGAARPGAQAAPADAAAPGRAGRRAPTARRATTCSRRSGPASPAPTSCS